MQGKALPSMAVRKYKVCTFAIMTNTWEAAGLASELQTKRLGCSIRSKRISNIIPVHFSSAACLSVLLPVTPD